MCYNEENEQEGMTQMAIPDGKSRIAITLSDEARKQVEALAAADDRTVSIFIERLIRKRYEEFKQGN